MLLASKSVAVSSRCAIIWVLSLLLERETNDPVLLPLATLPLVGLCSEGTRPASPVLAAVVKQELAACMNATQRKEYKPRSPLAAHLLLLLLLARFSFARRDI